MSSAHTLEAEGHDLYLDEVARKNFAKFLGFSATSIEKASDELQVEMFNYFIEKHSMSEVVIHFYGNQGYVFDRGVVDFYRADRELFPIHDTLDSVADVHTQELQRVGDYEVVAHSSDGTKTTVDIISPVELQSWSDQRYNLRVGVRLIVDVDTARSSYVESLLEFTPKSETGPSRFFIPVPLKSLAGKVSSKGRSAEEVVDVFTEAVGNACLVSENLAAHDLAQLYDGPMSEPEPKIDAILEGAGIPKSTQTKIKNRVWEDYLHFFSEREVSELTAIIMVGEQSPLLGKSRRKVESHLGDLIAHGGEHVETCEYCTQRLPNN